MEAVDMPPLKDVTGQRFGRLVAVERGEDRIYPYGHYPRWRCSCDCGKEALVLGQSLRSGNTTSCGCHLAEQRSEIGRKGGSATAAKLTPEQRREKARQANAAMTPETRSENGRKSILTRCGPGGNPFAHMTPEQMSESSRKGGLKAGRITAALMLADPRYHDPSHPAWRANTAEEWQRIADYLKAFEARSGVLA